MIQMASDSTPIPSTVTDGWRLSEVVRELASLSDALQRLGYSYEAYQLREAAKRLMRDSSDIQAS